MSRFSGKNSFMLSMREQQRLRGMSKKDRKKEKLLSKITDDGKVSKKEARKLQKKGLTERDLQRYDAKSFRRAQQDFDERGNRDRQRRPAAQGPSYSPLVISKGAGRKFGDLRPQSSRPQQQTEADPTPTGFNPNYLPTDFDDQEPGGSTTEPEGPSAEETFADLLAQLQTSFGDTMQQQATMFQDMQIAQDDRMAALQEQMQQQMLANQQAMLYNQNRPQVAGVQSAASSAGTPMQIARSGVTGAFGRTGMRISSLNV